MADPLTLSVDDLAAAFRRRTLSPVELVTACLERIDATDEVIGAFVHVRRDAALAEASVAEAELRQGLDRGPLHGIPVGVKDLVDVRGEPTEAGSPLRAGRIAAEDAEVVRRLRQGGAVVVGKTRTDQFAYGASTPGTTNPWAADRVAGGSSGGSAAAVAAGQCPLAIGTDTAGSIRIPAALCGVVGLKPTHGQVPRRGVVPLAWSFDNVGPIGRSVADVAAMFAVLAAQDAGPTPAGSDGGLTGLRVGVPTSHFVEDLDPEVASAFAAVLDRLRDAGADLVPASIPGPERYEAILYTMLLPEAAAYHAGDFPSRADQYSSQLRKALTIGSTVPAVDYVQAQRLRGVVVEEWRALYETVDVVIAPTVPLPALPRTQRVVEWPGGRSESVNAAYVRLCLAGNLTGFPAITLPCGRTADGLPLGVQLFAGPHQDTRLLSLARTLEPTLPPPQVFRVPAG